MSAEQTTDAVSAAPAEAPAGAQTPEAIQSPDSPEQMFPAAYVKQLRDEAAAARVKLKGFEDAQKTELQRATDDADAARKEASEARANEARFRVAIAHGIAEDHLEFLTGTTEEELEAQAVKLSALIATNTPAPRSVVPGDVEKTELALNGSGIENALRSALGINH